MNGRVRFRQIARAALAADARLQAVTQLSAWSGNIAASELPVLAVVTPQERIQPETLDEFERSTLLQVVVKRLGDDDLEDVLDDDADAVETCVFLAMMAEGFRCLPEDLSITINSDGEQRVGTAVVNFRLTWHRSIEG
ncbi:hypothetical protein DWF04_022745 [Cereibacter sphaeroides f. sp. denitrificans]|nr:hypothetical protein DWF04_15420 [Cereibacter sphaeroides f. sp. denitrificans]